MPIEFTKKDHKYYTKGNKEEQYNPVSSVIASYKNKFRKDYWSTFKALQKLYTKKEWKNVTKGFIPGDDALILHAVRFVDDKDLAKARQEILDEWEAKNKKSIVKGNKYHDAREQKAYERGFELNPFTNEEVPISKTNYSMFEDSEIPVEKGSNKLDKKCSLVNDLFELEDGYYPELLIWNEEYKLAGQADKIFIETDETLGTRGIYVDDFKTNNKIKQKGYRGKKMKPPLQHLDDCNYNHYRLQISTYAWMLEQFGYEVKNTAFHHYNKKYEFDYMRDEIENMLKDFKKSS